MRLTCGKPFAVHLYQIMSVYVYTVLHHQQSTNSITASGRSFINITNNRGPNTLPCGIPLKTGLKSEYFELTRTCCCLCKRKPSVQLSNSWEIPYDCNLLRRRYMSRQAQGQCSVHTAMNTVASYLLVFTARSASVALYCRGKKLSVSLSDRPSVYNVGGS